MRADFTSFRASCAARIVPEAPPPTIATVTRRSDLVVRPRLRIRRTRPPAGHVIVHVGDGLARRLGEHPRHDRMNQPRKPCADQASADHDGARPVGRPSSSRASADVQGTCGAPVPNRLPLYPASPSASILEVTGDPDRIRTCDLQIRNLVLYPAELRGRLPHRIGQAARQSIDLGRRHDRKRQRRDRNAFVAQRLGLFERRIAVNRSRSASPRASRARCRRSVADPARILERSACSAASRGERIVGCPCAEPAAPSAPCRRPPTGKAGTATSPPSAAHRSPRSSGTRPRRSGRVAALRSKTIISVTASGIGPAVVEAGMRERTSEMRAEVDIGKAEARTRSPMSSRTSPHGSITSEWPNVVRPSSCWPTWAAATTNSPGLDRARTQQDMPMRLPVGTVKAAGTAITSASDSASRANKPGKRKS